MAKRPLRSSMLAENGTAAPVLCSEENSTYICNMEIPSTHPESFYNTKNDFGSPDHQNNIVAKQPLSATLRERLRKTRRSFNSALSVAKRLKVDCEENEGSANCAIGDGLPAKNDECGVNSIKVPQSYSSLCTPDICLSEVRTAIETHSQAAVMDPIYHQDKLQEKRRLLKQVKQKEEQLRRLKMVKLYRAKNNLTELQSLTEKWRKSSQCLLYELQNTLSTENRKISLTQIIESCGLDEKLLHYSRSEEDFEDL
ncbi:swi5-dependent recombination DNA repair protein 1 homolog [Rhinophrynus dorsalis]